MIAFLTAALAPVVYLIVRFNLFQTKSEIQINLWTIVAVIVLVGVLSTIIHYCIASLKTKYFWWKQILVGFVKVILPLILILFVVTWLAENMVIMQEVLKVIILCEAVAIVINPFPKWCFDNNIDGLVEITDKLFHREAKEEE